MAASNQHPAVGIDLGTTCSCVGVWQRGRVEILANDQGNRITPSCVSFDDTERIIGDNAKNAANAVFSIKRLIGRDFSDPYVQNDIKNWPFKVIAGADGKPKIVVKYQGNEMKFIPEEISAMVLSKMKETAETYLGQKVENAVVTVPAYFNDAQRRSTIDAGRIAGLNVQRIMDEPTAAAVAFGFENVIGKSATKNVFVFDLGGGTFDVSILSMAHDEFKAKAIAGDTHLGGEDFNDRMVNHCIQEFKRKYNVDIAGNMKAKRRLRTACEKAKIHLSSQTQAKIEVDCLYDGHDFSCVVSQAWFENLNADLFEKCMDLVRDCLKEAKMEKDKIDLVVLVGGSTRIPKVQNMIEEYFQGKKIFKGINPDEAIAYGATIEAARLSEQCYHLQDLAIGDVNPLSLGIGFEGDIMEFVIPRNTCIPTKKTTVATTTTDNQTTVRIKVYEGERPDTKHNNLLGHFVLGGIAPAPREEPRIDVTLEIDPNGILSVTAENRATGQKEKITITNDDARISNQDIERMLRDAERLKANDQMYKRNHNAWNSLEMHVYKMKNAMNGSAARELPFALKSIIQDAIDRASKLVEQRPLPSAADSERTMEELKSFSHAIGLS